MIDFLLAPSPLPNWYILIMSVTLILSGLALMGKPK